MKLGRMPEEFSFPSIDRTCYRFSAYAKKREETSLRVIRVPCRWLMNMASGEKADQRRQRNSERT